MTIAIFKFLLLRLIVLNMLAQSNAGSLVWQHLLGRWWSTVQNRGCYRKNIIKYDYSINLTRVS